MDTRTFGSVSLTEPMEILIKDIKAARMKIIRHRMEQTNIHYPEVTNSEVKPLSDAEIIKLALIREFNHQTRVVSDINKIKKPNED